MRLEGRSRKGRHTREKVKKSESALGAKRGDGGCLGNGGGLEDGIRQKRTENRAWASNDRGGQKRKKEGGK